MFSWFKRQKNKHEQEQKKKLLTASSDYKTLTYQNKKTGKHFSIHFISSLIDEHILDTTILSPLLEEEFEQLEDLKKIVPGEFEISTDEKKLEEKMFSGHVVLKIESEPKKFAFLAARKEIVRNISLPEVEFSVVGPKEAFTELIEQNINLIRKRLPIKELVIEEFKVGKLTKTKVAVLYIDGICDKENVNTVRQRINEIEIDHIIDSSYIVELISDNHNSPFPQLLDTERPDRIASVLAEGKVAIMVDGSPHVLIGPTTLVEFFGSFEDYFLNYILASFFRIIRMFSVLFSLLITPIYVATLTYHHELIPKDLLNTLVSSRQGIPLPPFLEAMFLELTIELLREAGARLPTKVGQTIGIVGGIVIGTASVEAGLTSNVLLIIVALAALASFTTPVYKMGNTIRLLRFPFLIFAQMWGLLGIVFLFCVLLVHLLRLTSLGRPFLEPIYPLRLSDFKDSIVRLSFESQAKRPKLLRPKDDFRYSPKKAKEYKDIDE